ncbi:MAG TPA: hypothetical protein VHO91_21315, partial [Rhodopila sp.]|nr:hypothetical protein [Rhodopila sp.]
MTKIPEPYFDQTPHPFGNGPVDPVVYDAGVAALRQRTVNFAAKRYADMMFVSGLDRSAADRHFRLRPAPAPAGLDPGPASADIQAEARAAFAEGRISIETDAADRRATVRWVGDGFTLTGHALARPGYGGILRGPHARLGFDPQPVPRAFPDKGRAWPIGDAVEAGQPPLALASALDAFFATSSGAYGVLVASPDRVLMERYSAFGGPARATP